MKLRLFKLALRNTQRNKRRSLLAMISIVSAIVLIVIMQAMMTGMMSGVVRNTTRTETGHIRISGGEFEKRSKFFPVTESIVDGSSLVEKIKASELGKEIQTITERITFGVILSNGGKTKAAMGIAGDIQNEKELLQMDQVISEGRYLENDREIIIGYKLAEQLRYKVGDTIKVMAQGADYALHMRKFEIVGLFNSGLGNLDKGFFQINLNDAEKLLRMDGATQQIIVMLNDYGKANKVAKSIVELINDEDVTVKSWTEIGFAYNYATMAETVYGIMYAIIAMLGAFIIGNIMMMVVMERKREIGIMKSMGFTPKTIQFLFLTEGMTLGALGSIIGIIIAIILILLFNIKGLDISEMLGGIDNMGFENIIFFVLEPAKVFGIFCLGLFVSTIVSYLPARRASKMSPVDSIRG
jgi:putative ABC transport system permease protein